MMRSHYASEISPAMDGQTVELAGWAHEIRNLGKLRFIVLRDRSGLVQVTAKKGVASEEIFEEMGKITVKETLLRIEGKVKAEKQAPKGFEIVPLKIEVLNPVTETIPFELTGKVPAEIDVRLDNRFVDLRRLETQAIFKIRSEMLRIFREVLLAKKFQEMTPPCIVAAATEGGTDLFEVQYFEKKAYLAQSPQLYKQLAVIGGMDRVFMTSPVFRAEKHNTTAHLNEILQMDIEMGFADHNEVMDILGEVLIAVIKGVKENCPEELKLLGQELKVPKEVRKHTYSEIVELLNKKGEKIEWGEDFAAGRTYGSAPCSRGTG
ncbi:MAG: aspartate--tRNA(Asn) ligase [Candidatus Micrarchaeota archaeon]|nr:aspartate--tRNA(Asn) ligase [Candidatus Micrarchaeota archaeon]